VAATGTPDGILLVDKPGGMTSAGVVREVKRAHRLRAIGHLGTLDPMATGLLPLCVGAGTKIAQFLLAERKAYTGTIRLGVATDTLDVEGTIVAEAPVPELDAARLAAVARGIEGPGEQRPPMYSAVKQQGRKLYELARQGVTVERAARLVTIHHLELTLVAGERATVAFAASCSKGTYVRVLAEDVARALGTVGTLASLRRTEFGDFRVDEAQALDAILGRPPGDLTVVAPEEALRSARRVPVGPAQAFAVASGQRAALAAIAPPAADERLAALLAPDGRLLAVLEAEGGRWALRRVVLPEASELYRS
jgi:tRNA pseudouridine55 synthase